jgi:hypothetical protein
MNNPNGPCFVVSRPVPRPGDRLTPFPYAVVFGSKVANCCSLRLPNAKVPAKRASTSKLGICPVFRMPSFSKPKHQHLPNKPFQLQYPQRDNMKI